MKAIIAVNNLGYIGLNDTIPWRSSEDFKHFKKLTTHDDRPSLLLVGYNTKQKLPPLKGRELIVDSRDSLDVPEDGGDIWWVHEVDWCIGGKKTYEKFCQFFTELHISHIDDNTVGDCMFPDLRNLNKKCKVYNYYFKTNETI